jgi:hypothetical protein
LEVKPMKPQEVFRLAENHPQSRESGLTYLEAAEAIRLAVAAERERCAKIAENYVSDDFDAVMLARTIRSGA